MKTIMKRAICITNGEQGENHAGMQMLGNGLADKGYNLEDALKFKKNLKIWVELLLYMI